MKNTDQSKAEAMRFHIEACSKSGLTVKDYCAQNGIVKSGYYYWLKKLNVASKAPGFIAVNVTPNVALEITYPNGVQLSFTGAINIATVKALVCCI
jgi:hypothetical protein